MKEKKKLSLSVWIFIGMIAGILVGLCFLKTPEFTTDYLKPIGTIYINLLKFLVVPVVLFSITDGVVSLKDLKRVGSVGLRTFVYYMFTTAIAVVIGLVAGVADGGKHPAVLQGTDVGRNVDDLGGVRVKEQLARRCVVVGELDRDAGPAGSLDPERLPYA